MPIAAVPRYLGQDFRDASPGMRFGMYLPVWTARSDQEQEINDRKSQKSPKGRKISDLVERQGMDAAIREYATGLWRKNDHASHQAWTAVTRLTKRDLNLMQALDQRQRTLASQKEHENRLLSLYARTVAPFTTGLGNEHPLENGFSFLNPYGLPYLPGSGVKGVVRKAALELATGEWGESYGWSDDKRYPLFQGPEEKRAPVLDAQQNPVKLSDIDILFGPEPENEHHVRGVLSFWDVIPQIEGDSLMLEIMTPHQSSYYQNGEQPHESGQPNPIFFLTVPPGSGFTFHVTCDVERLRVLAPDLAENGHWQTLLTGTFEHAFTWLGFGAKTAVGYGAMEREKMSAQESEIEMSGEHSEPSPSQESMSPEEREIETLRSRFEADKAAGGPEPQGELASLRVELLRNAQQWESTELRRQAAELIEETERWLSWPKKKRDERRRMLQALRADRNEE